MRQHHTGGMCARETEHPCTHTRTFKPNRHIEGEHGLRSSSVRLVRVTASPCTHGEPFVRLVSLALRFEVLDELQGVSVAWWRIPTGARGIRGLLLLGHGCGGTGRLALRALPYGPPI